VYNLYFEVHNQFEKKMTNYFFACRLPKPFIVESALSIEEVLGSSRGSGMKSEYVGEKVTGKVPSNEGKGDNVGSSIAFVIVSMF